MNCPDCDLRQQLDDAYAEYEDESDDVKLLARIKLLDDAVDALPKMRIISHEEFECTRCHNIIFVPDM